MSSIVRTLAWAIHSLLTRAVRLGREFAHALSHNGLYGSMSGVGSRKYNAASESFFALRQRNVLDRRRSTSQPDYAWRSCCRNCGLNSHPGESTERGCRLRSKSEQVVPVEK